MPEETMKMTEHAMLDTAPLRYGVIPPKWVILRNMEYDDVGTQNQKPKEIKSGNKHYLADCFAKDTGAFLFSGRFVVGKPRRDDYYDNIISVLPKTPDLSQRAVSEVIRDLRLKQRITAEYIKDKIYPLYSQGRFSSVELLMDFFVQEGVAEKTKDLHNYIAELENGSETKDELLRVKDETILQQEKKIIKLESAKPSYKSTDGVELSPVMTLKAVATSQRKNAKGQLVECTILTFEEPDTPARIMDKWADSDGKITAKAREMIGKKVRTSSWRPEIFSPLNWWRDIYISE